MYEVNLHRHLPLPLSFSPQRCQVALIFKDIRSSFTTKTTTHILEKYCNLAALKGRVGRERREEDGVCAPISQFQILIKNRPIYDTISSFLKICINKYVNITSELITARDTFDVSVDQTVAALRQLATKQFSGGWQKFSGGLNNFPLVFRMPAHPEISVLFSFKLQCSASRHSPCMLYLDCVGSGRALGGLSNMAGEIPKMCIHFWMTLGAGKNLARIFLLFLNKTKVLRPLEHPRLLLLWV